MSKADNKDTPQLKDEVLELAAKIEKGLTIDKKTGAGSEKEGADLYESNLPEGTTMEHVRNVSDYNTNFVAASAYAFGRIAVKAMAGNKDLEQATAEVKMGGRDRVSINVARQQTYTNHLGGGGETVKFGVVTSRFDVKAGRNSGQLKVARNMIAELAMQELK